MSHSLEANSSMLIQGRESRGLRQAEVAAAMSVHLAEPVSQAYVSKAEAGRVIVTGERLEAFSQVLRYPVSVLSADPDVDGAGVGLIHHRKRASLGAPALRTIHAQLLFGRYQVQNLMKEAGGHHHQFFRHELTDEDSPDEIAIKVRNEWNLGLGPLSDLIGVIEAAGGVVLLRDLDTRELDAVSIWAAEGFPVFLLNASAPPDRVRFSLAHELGHMILHRTPGTTAIQERQADEFASQFLMPSGSIRDQLRAGVDINTLARLKPVWGTSMAALARRGWDLNALSDWQYRNITIEMTTLGYKVQEPVSIKPEVPSTIDNVVTALTRDRGFTVDKLAATAGLFPDEFELLYQAKTSH